MYRHVFLNSDYLSILKQLVGTHTENEGYTETIDPACSYSIHHVDSCTRLLVYTMRCKFVHSAPPYERLGGSSKLSAKVRSPLSGQETR